MHKRERGVGVMAEIVGKCRRYGLGLVKEVRMKKKRSSLPNRHPEDSPRRTLLNGSGIVVSRNKQKKKKPETGNWTGNASGYPSNLASLTETPTHDGVSMETPKGDILCKDREKPLPDGRYYVQS